MRARSRLLALLLILGLTLGPAATALALDEPELPPRPAAAGPLPEDKLPLYEQYPASAYTVDALSVDSAASQTLIWTNTALSLKAWLVKLSIRSLQYALNLDVGAGLRAPAGQAMAALRARLWDADGGALVVAGLVIAGGAALLLYLSRRHAQRAWLVLGSATAVLLIGFALLLGGPGWLQTDAAVARSLGRGTVEAVARTIPEAGDGNGLTELVAGELWDVLVYQPWVLSEFGSVDNATRFSDRGGTPGAAFLGLPPSGRINSYLSMPASERLIALPWWSPDYLVRRLGLALTSGLAAVVACAALLLLAVGVLFYQVVLTLLLATAPLWLLISLLWPGGVRLTRWFLEHALGALVQLVLLPGVLAVFLALSHALHGLAADLGWAAAGLLQALLAAVIWYYRRLPLHALGVLRRRAAAPPLPEPAPAPAAAVVTRGEGAARALPVPREQPERTPAVAPALTLPAWRVAPEAPPAAAVEASFVPVQERGLVLPPVRLAERESAPGGPAAETPLQVELRVIEQRLAEVRQGGRDPAAVVVQAGGARPVRPATSLPTLPLDQQRRAARLPGA